MFVDNKKVPNNYLNYNLMIWHQAKLFIINAMPNVKRVCAFFTNYRLQEYPQSSIIAKFNFTSNPEPST